MLCKVLRHPMSNENVKYRALSSYKDIAQFIENIPVSTVNRGIALAKSVIVIPSFTTLYRRVVGADVGGAESKYQSSWSINRCANCVDIKHCFTLSWLSSVTIIGT